MIDVSLHGYTHKMIRHYFDCIQCFSKLLSPVFQLIITALCFFYVLFHFCDKGHERSALFHGCLSSQQVHALYAGRAFMDWMYPRITHVLFKGKLVTVPIAAKALQRQARGDDPHFRWIRLNHRCQDLQQESITFAFFAFGNMHKVNQLSRVNCQGKPPLGYGLLRHEHALHVGMFNNGDLRLERVLFQHIAALQAFPAVLKGRVIRCCCNRHRADAHADTRFVHHLEHVPEALVFFSQEKTATVIVFTHAELRDRRSAVTHFMIAACAIHVVELNISGPGNTVLGNHEKRKPFNPRRRAFYTRQHKVDDIISTVAIAT